MSADAAPAPRTRGPRNPVRYRNKLTLLGITEPAAWDYDGGKRREPVLDTDYHPPRVVRQVGWRHCMKCTRPFFSEDAVRLRMCHDCRSDEDRFA